MKQSTAIGLCAVLVTAATLPLVSQTPPAKYTSFRKERGPENLPWTRFHPATPPYQPTDAEKQQIQSKIDQLGAMINELRSPLRADVEIYYEAARWKMAYPEEFFRQRSVADTLSVLDKGLERAAQLKEANRPGQHRKDAWFAVTARRWTGPCSLSG